MRIQIELIADLPSMWPFWLSYVQGARRVTDERKKIEEEEESW